MGPDHHAHPHGHHHHHAHHAQSARRLGVALLLAASFLAAEVVGGLLTGSLALLADAGHMLSDVAALVLALAAIALSRRPPSATRTFGHHRAEVLAALFNGLALVVIAGVVVREAIERWTSPPEVLAGPMMIVAFGGFVVNVLAMAVLHGGAGDSLNVRAAFLHVLADALGSVGALASGAAIYWLDWRWADPAASVLIAVLVLVSALGLLRQTVRVLMQATPPDLDLDEVKGAMEQTSGVREVHDLHAWTLTSGKELLTAHVVLDDPVAWSGVLEALHHLLIDERGIGHVTLQPELPDAGPCGCAFGAPTTTSS
jgi:cobalt-zinc-cadmium efflux system protein